MLFALLARAALAEDAPEVAVAPGKGLTIRAADDRFSMNLRARVQLRETVFVSVPDAEGARDVSLLTQIYTTRIWLGGHILNPNTTYLLQLAVSPRDYRDGAISPIYDAYFDLTYNPNLSVRVGQLFVPFDRLRTIREFALQMIDRPRVVSELTLDRDIGVYAYSDHLGGERSPVAYRLGVFGGSGTNELAAHPPGGLFVGRIELRPFGPVDDDQEGDLTRRDQVGVALGLGGAYNHATTRARSTTSTVFQGGTANYLHVAADAVLKYRGFAWENEWVARVASADTIESVDDDGIPVTEYTRSGWGLVSQPSMMLSDRVEVVARYGRLAANEGTDPTYLADAEARANEVALGVNVYLNGHRFKIQNGIGAFFGAAPADAELNAQSVIDVMF